MTPSYLCFNSSSTSHHEGRSHLYVLLLLLHIDRKTVHTSCSFAFPRNRSAESQKEMFFQPFKKPHPIRFGPVRFHSFFSMHPFPSKQVASTNPSTVWWLDPATWIRPHRSSDGQFGGVRRGCDSRRMYGGLWALTELALRRRFHLSEIDLSRGPRTFAHALLVSLERRRATPGFKVLFSSQTEFPLRKKRWPEKSVSITVLSHEVSQLHRIFPVKSTGHEILVPNQFSAPPDVHCFFLASTSQPSTFVPWLNKGMWKGSLRAICNSFIIAYSIHQYRIFLIRGSFSCCLVNNSVSSLSF